MNRIIRVPTETFEQWLDEQKIDKANVLLGNEYSTAVAQLLFGKGGFTTRKGKGERNTVQRKLAYTNELHKRYTASVLVEEKEVPLDMTKEADQAYVRVMERRAQRKAELKTKREDI